MGRCNPGISQVGAPHSRNGFDEFAVTVRAKGGEMLGCIPRRCIKSVSDRLALGIANDPVDLVTFYEPEVYEGP